MIRDRNFYSNLESIVNTVPKTASKEITGVEDVVTTLNFCARYPHACKAIIVALVVAALAAIIAFSLGASIPVIALSGVSAGFFAGGSIFFALKVKNWVEHTEVVAAMP